MTWRVYVDRQAVARNKSTGAHEPVLRLESPDGSVIRHEELDLPPGSRVVCRPEDPRACGAVVWVECDERPTPVPIWISVEEYQADPEGWRLRSFVRPVHVSDGRRSMMLASWTCNI